MDTRTGDFRYAVAVLRRDRGFTAAALLALTLGIGATTAVCSVLYGVLVACLLPARRAAGSNPAALLRE